MKYNSDGKYLENAVKYLCIYANIGFYIGYMLTIHFMWTS